MKTKQLVAMAALALLVALPARAAEVVSSNIVGYEKINVPANAMDIVAVQFQDVGENGVIGLQSITVEGYSPSGVDWIKIYDPSTSRYVTARYWGEEADGGVYDPSDAEYNNPLGSGWGDVDQFAINVTLDAGQAVWTQAETGGKLVVSGEVASTNKVVIPANTMTLVGNPLPMAVPLQSITVEGYSPSGVDWIKIYDPSTSRYVTARYWGEEADGGVYDPSDTEYENPLGAGWGDVDQFMITTTISAGQGFWTQSETGGKLVFPAVPAN